MGSRHAQPCPRAQSPKQLGAGTADSVSFVPCGHAMPFGRGDEEANPVRHGLANQPLHSRQWLVAKSHIPQ